MVLSERTASEFLSTSPQKSKLKRPLMDHGPLTMTSTERRVKLSERNVSTTSIDPDLGNLQSTVLQAARQKVRRAEEEGTRWRENGKTGGGGKGGEGGSGPRAARSLPVNNYSIVASRGELARNNRTHVDEALVVAAKKRSTIANGRERTKEDSPRRDIVGKQTRKQLRKDQRVTNVLPSPTLLPKYRSLPENLKEVTKGKALFGASEEGGILKRSSAFLASLAQSSVKAAERKAEDSRKPSNKIIDVEGYVPEYAKGYFSNRTNGNDLLVRSPSVQTLPTSWKKKTGSAVKKSVSFSSDTSFQEKKGSLGKAPVHEVKIYRKGVLQDRETKEGIVSKVPPSWETPSGGPAALLRAAREADDAGLKEIAARARKFGVRDMDVNMVDSSGRSAISYMAGNGATAMLETALSFEGIDPNLPDKEGNTPLHFAAQAGQTECLNILLQRCPDIEVDARNSLGFTPLMKAALQGRTKCAKILLFAGANPTLRDHGRGLRAEQWARFCGRYVCAEVIERFARHRLLERTTSCRWGSEPELAAKVLQGKVTPIPTAVAPQPSSGLKSKIRKVFRTTSGPDRSFSLVSQLTSAALCASSPALPKPGDIPPVVKSILRPLSVPQLRITLVAQPEIREKTGDKYGTSFNEKIENSIVKPPRVKKKNK